MTKKNEPKGPAIVRFLSKNINRRSPTMEDIKGVILGENKEWKQCPKCHGYGDYFDKNTKTYRNCTCENGLVRREE